MDGIEKFAGKVIDLADKVSEGAARVSGAVKGAGVGAKTAPAHPYVVPVLLGVGVFLMLSLMAKHK